MAAGRRTRQGEGAQSTRRQSNALQRYFEDEATDLLKVVWILTKGAMTAGWALLCGAFVAWLRNTLFHGNELYPVAIWMASDGAAMMGFIVSILRDLQRMWSRKP